MSTKVGWRAGYEATSTSANQKWKLFQLHESITLNWSQFVMCHAPTITERCQMMDHAACAHVYFHVSLKLLTSSPIYIFPCMMFCEEGTVWNNESIVTELHVQWCYSKPIVLVYCSLEITTEVYGSSCHCPYHLVPGKDTQNAFWPEPKYREGLWLLLCIGQRAPKLCPPIFLSINAWGGDFTPTFV